MPDYQYDVAISFAGEDRSIAEDIARRLDAAGYSVFYDDFEAERLWGRDLPVELGKVYREGARFCVLLVSRHYKSKMWTNFERQYVISRLMSEHDNYVLPIRIDDAEIPGLPPTIGYLSLERYSLNEILSLLLKKLGAPTGKRKDINLSVEDLRTAEEVLQACNRRAIFTRMDSEINLKPMFDSIENCAGLLEQLGPRFRSSELQNLTLELVKELDTLERFRLITGPERESLNLSDSLRANIDFQKERVIRSIHRIRRSSGVAIQLPTELDHYHFYHIQDAEAPVDYDR
jgi:hypothetical protein